MSGERNPDIPDFTALLARSGQGDRDARNRLFEAAYRDLRIMARSLMRGERADHTLNPTEVVHNVYMKLVDYEPESVSNRREFFAVCATAMRHILADYGRRRARAKYGGGVVHIPVDDERLEWDPGATNDHGYRPIDYADVLFDLEKVNARAATALDLKIYGNATFEDIADYLGVSVRTATRDVQMGFAWVHRELVSEGKGPR